MENANSKLLHSELTDKIIGVYYDVYNELGHGFLESVYSNCMYLALSSSGLTVRREVPIPVYFRSTDVGQFKADLVVSRCVLIELKAVQSRERAHEAQVMNYLRGTELEVASCSTLARTGRSSEDSFLKMLTRESAFIRVYPR